MALVVSVDDDLPRLFFLFLFLLPLFLLGPAILFQFLVHDLDLVLLFHGALEVLTLLLLQVLFYHFLLFHHLLVVLLLQLFLFHLVLFLQLFHLFLQTTHF